MSVAKVAIQFTAIDLLSRGIDKMKNRLDSFKNAGIDAQRSFNKMTASLKFAGAAGILTKSVYNGLKPAISAAGNLQSEMLGVRAEIAGMGKDAGKFEKQISSTAFGVQAWTPFDQSQIVALEKQLIKSGANIQSITSKTGATVAAAALAIQEGMDPVEAGKSLIRLATPFKIAADQYMNVADIITRAAAVSPVGAAEIVETAKYAAQPVSALGRSVEELLTLSAVLAKSGIDASMAGTGLRQFFTQAAKTDTLKDANGNLIETSEIIKKLRTGFKGLGKAELLERLTRGFGMRGAPIALALMATGDASYENVIEAMKRATPLQEKINVRMQGYNAQLNSLKGTSKSIIAQLYQPALGPLTDLLKGTNELLTDFGKLVQEKSTISEFVSKFSLGTLAAGGLATAGLGGAALLFGKKALKGMGGIKGLFGDLTSTFTGVVKGKALEAAAGIKPVFVTNWPSGMGGTGVTGDLNEKLKALKGGSAADIADIAAEAGGGAAAVGAGKGFLSWIGTKIPSFLPESFLGKLAGMGKIGGGLAAPVGAAGTLTTLGVAGAGLGIGHLIGRLIDQNDFISDKLDKAVGFLFDITPDMGISDFLAGVPELVPAVVKESNNSERGKAPLTALKATVPGVRDTKLEKVLTERTVERAETILKTEKVIREKTSGETKTVPSLKNNINLNIRIDERGRAITETSDDTRVNTTINRGGLGG